MFKYRETTLGDMAPGVIFWRAWDGKVNGVRTYAPRQSYVLTPDRGHVVEVGEFGRRWQLADTGMHALTVVGTTGQPLR